jgi:MFS family permease
MAVTERAGTQLRRARVAVSLMFVTHGAVSGSFATRVPWLADHLHLSAGTLGMALLAPAVGAVAAMPFAGRLVHRYSGRTITRILIAAWSVALLLPALAPDLPLLMVALLLYGVAAGTADVAMNAQGVVVEERLGRSIMSGLHGLWSLGALVASGVGALAAQAHLDARIHFAFVAAGLLVLCLTSGRWLLATRPDPDAAEPPAFALPTKAVLVIGLVGFCGIFGEGASADWAAVYLRDITHTGAGIAATAYTGFALAMTAGRLVGDAVVRRIGHVWTVRWGGILGTAGGALVVLARTPPLGILGFALIGVGVSVVIPLAFAAAGRIGEHPAREIAGVATISYGAGTAAPAIIGWIAQASSLSVSFVLVTVLIAVIAVAAGAFRPPVQAPAATRAR